MASIKVRRVYEDARPGDGFRVLVDRVWPRGVTKGRAKVDVWLKSVAPSTELRTWFNHEPQKWSVFKKCYFAELDQNPSGLDELRKRVGHGTITLVFSARDVRHNQAVALREYLERLLNG